MTDLSIIIVSWNVADLLAACLESILAGPVCVVSADDSAPDCGDRLSVEILVIESASTDHTMEVLGRFPQVRVLAQKENVGFVRGNNIGLTAAEGRYVMLLNPDTEVIGDALPVLAAFLDAHPDVGIVGPHTLNTDGSTQSTRRHFPTLLTALFESTWLQPYAPPGVLRHYYVSDAPDDAILDVDWMQGSALMARREVFEQIGGMDERIVMYSDELDWCRRAKDAGWRVVYVGAAQIVHHGGKSSEQVAAQRHMYFQQSKVYYFRKHHGPLAAGFLRRYLLVLYAWQWGLEWLKFRLGHKPELRRARMAAYREVLRSGLQLAR